MKIVIIGYGVVGSAIGAWFASRGIDAAPYDPPKNIGDIDDVRAADTVFVCVPTPYWPITGFDARFLERAIAAIDGSKLIVIKSTVLPGTTEDLQRRYPQHRFIFNPEFLREAHAVEDMARPDRQIVGVTPESAPFAAELLELLPPAPFVRVCAARDAEIAKYAANSFLAVKVSFANELFELCERGGMDFDAVRDIVGADQRIGPSHLDVFADGYRGYGGKCLPKDSKSLLDLASDLGIELGVLSAADAMNERLTAAPIRRERQHTRVDDELEVRDTTRRAA